MWKNKILKTTKLSPNSTKKKTELSLESAKHIKPLEIGLEAKRKRKKNDFKLPILPNTANEALWPIKTSSGEIKKFLK